MRGATPIPGTACDVRFRRWLVLVDACRRSWPSPVASSGIGRKTERATCGASFWEASDADAGSWVDRLSVARVLNPGQIFMDLGDYH